MDPHEQQIMKRVMGLAKPQSMMQQLNHFFTDKVDVIVEEVEGGEVQRKIKSCSVCKIQKLNHIVRE